MRNNATMSANIARGLRKLFRVPKREGQRECDAQGSMMSGWIHDAGLEDSLDEEMSSPERTCGSAAREARFTGSGRPESSPERTRVHVLAGRRARQGSSVSSSKNSELASSIFAPPASAHGSTTPTALAASFASALPSITLCSAGAVADTERHATAQASGTVQTRALISHEFATKLANP